MGRIFWNDLKGLGMTPEAVGEDRLSSLLDRLDSVLGNSPHIFTSEEIVMIEQTVEFAAALNYDATTIKRMTTIYSRVEGTVKLLQSFGIAVAFIVIVWGNWQRLMEFVFGGKTP